MNERILLELGMTKNEIKVYLALLRFGSASVGEITKDSGVHRRNVYDALERLSEKGLVGHVTIGGVKFFEGTDPHNLFNVIKKERESSDEKEKKIKKLVSELLKTNKLPKEKQDVKIFRGSESRRIVFEDILKSTKQNLVLGAHTPSELSQRFLSQWHKRRVKAGVKDKLIFNKRDPYAELLSKFPFTEVRFAPKEINSKSAINIYGNRVAMLLWSNEQPISIVIDNKKVANDFREYFKFLWEISKPKK